jgi:DNA-binding transcriptional regulator GbsR (MarR family)
MERHDEKKAFSIFRRQFPLLTMQEVRDVRQAHKNKQTEMSSLRDRIALAAVKRELSSFDANKVSKEFVQWFDFETYDLTAEDVFRFIEKRYGTPSDSDFNAVWKAVNALRR